MDICHSIKNKTNRNIFKEKFFLFPNISEDKKFDIDYKCSV